VDWSIDKIQSHWANFDFHQPTGGILNHGFLPILVLENHQQTILIIQVWFMVDIATT
jgi:hypothetical protein